MGYGNVSAADQADQIYIEAAGAREIAFWNDGTQRMVIDGSGEVGIGVLVPDTLLDISGAAADGDFLIDIQNTTASGEFIQFINSSGNRAAEVRQTAGGQGSISVLLRSWIFEPRTVRSLAIVRFTPFPVR